MQRRSHIKTDREYIIDLAGEDGNAYSLLGIAGRWARQMGLDGDAIDADMTSGNYEHLLTVFCKHFGQFVHFDNVPEQYGNALEEAVDAYGKRIEYTERDEGDY